MANPYSKPITATYKYKPLDISTLARPMAMAQQQYDAQVQAVDAALFELQGLSPDSQRAKEIKEYLNAGTEDIANKLMTSKDFRTAGRNLARLNKFYNSDEEISAIRSNYDNWTKAVERERKRVKKGDITQEDFDGWYNRQMQEFEDKGGTSYDDGIYNIIDTSGREINRAKELDEYALKLMQAKPSDRKTMLGHLVPTMSVGDKAIYSRLTEKHEYIDENELRNDIYRLISSSDRFRPWLQEKADYQYYFDSRNNPQFAAEKYGEWNAALDMQEKELEDRKAKLEKEGKYNKDAKAEYAELKKDIKDRRQSLIDGYAKSKGNYIKEEYLKGVQDNYYMNLASGLGGLGSFSKKDYAMKDLTLDIGNSITKKQEKNLENLTQATVSSSGEYFMVSPDVFEADDGYLENQNKSVSSNAFVTAMSGGLDNLTTTMNNQQQELNKFKKDLETNYTNKGLEIPEELQIELAELQTNYDNSERQYQYATKNLRKIITETDRNLKSEKGRKVSSELMRVQMRNDGERKNIIKDLFEAGEISTTDGVWKGVNGGNFNEASKQIIEDITEVYNNKTLQEQIRTLNEMEQFVADADMAKARVNKNKATLDNYLISGTTETNTSSYRNFETSWTEKVPLEEHITWANIGEDAIALRDNRDSFNPEGDDTGVMASLDLQSKAVRSFLNVDVIQNYEANHGKAPMYRQHQTHAVGGVYGKNWTRDIMSKEEAQKYYDEMWALEKAGDKEGLKAKIQEIKNKVMDNVNKDYADAQKIANDYKEYENQAAATFNRLDIKEQYVQIPDLLMSNSYLEYQKPIAELDDFIRRNPSSTNNLIVRYDEGTGNMIPTEKNDVPHLALDDKNKYIFNSLTRTTIGGETVAQYQASVTKLSDQELYDLFMFNEGLEEGEDGSKDYLWTSSNKKRFTDLSKGDSYREEGDLIDSSMFEITSYDEDGHPRYSNKFSPQFRAYLEGELSDGSGRNADITVKLGNTTIATAQQAIGVESSTFEAAIQSGDKEAAQAALSNLANVISVVETPNQKTQLYEGFDPDKTAYIEDKAVGITQNDFYLNVIREIMTGRRGQYREEQYDPISKKIRGIMYKPTESGQVQFRTYVRDEDGKIKDLGEYEVLNAAAGAGGMTASATMIYNNLYYMKGYGDLLNSIQ